MNTLKYSGPAEVSFNGETHKVEKLEFVTDEPSDAQVSKLKYTNEQDSKVTQITAPTRKQRRAARALEQRFRKRAVAHNCVLDRDCTAAGVAVEIESEAEFHKLHGARGEETCKACPVCEQFSFERPPRKPTKYTSAERAAITLQWRGRLAAAKEQAEQEAALRAESARVSMEQVSVNLSMIAAAKEEADQDLKILAQALDEEHAP